MMYSDLSGKMPSIGELKISQKDGGNRVSLIEVAAIGVCAAAAVVEEIKVRIKGIKIFPKT